MSMSQFTHESAHDHCMMAFFANVDLVFLLALPTLIGAAALKLPAANVLVSNKVCLLRVIDTATGAYEVRGRGGGDAVVDAKAASASYLLSVSGACLAAARVDGNHLVTPTQDAAPTYSEQQLLLHLRVRGQPCAVPDEHEQVGTKLLLSDEYVSVYEFRLAPGERAAYHRHRLPYCFVNLSSSTTQALASDASFVGEPAFQKSGHSVWVAPDALGEHGVLNVGESEFLQFIVECKVTSIA
jgi:hypothetical protein